MHRHCQATLDLGAGNAGVVYRIRYYPDNSRWAYRMKGSLFEGSLDGRTFTPLATVMEKPAASWNYIDLDVGAEPAAYRYLRYRAGRGFCTAGEIEYLGVMVTDLEAAGARADLAEDAPSTDAACPVVVSVAGTTALEGGAGGGRRLGNHNSADHAATVHANSRVHFSADSTPTVEGISPNSGSSLGGDTITISGSGFIPGKPEAHTVTLAGEDCVVTSVSPTTITCTTTKRGEELNDPEVVVSVDGHGEALVPATVAFRYLDRWSSLSTWFAAGGEPPVAGDSVIIPKNQAVLLDVSPPELFLLLVQGTLVFDRKDLALDANYILIKGGRFEVGTEAEPFTHNAVITLHGDRYESVEIPHAGAKVLAVSNEDLGHHHEGGMIHFHELGSLEIHGADRMTTWTKLESTVAAGDTELHLAEDVDWAAGDRLVVTSSTTRAADAEIVEVVARVSARHVSVTPLVRTHESYIYTPPAGAERHGTVDMRVEVGLLSRNVIIQGDENSASQKFGAHTMAIHGGVYHMENAGSCRVACRVVSRGGCCVWICESHLFLVVDDVVQRSVSAVRALCWGATATTCTWQATRRTRTSAATVSTTVSSVPSPFTVPTTL